MGMLVLGRKVGQVIEISVPGAEIIKVRVVNIEGNTIKIGVDAPRDVSVHREEIADKIRAEAGEKP